ncbi:MAG: hypothetical protein J1D87_02375 [Lachnospiraceae bacterium]|nr:hypothetical protein [Lachnospiraceae bacterium]
MTEAEREIYERGIEILRTGSDDFDVDYLYKFEHTERCIEVPWFASRLNKYNIESLLDVGFTFASHDYLRLILDWGGGGHKLVGTDIINPLKVQKRYPEEWWEEINNTTVYINDILNKPIAGELNDAVSLISTMEHIGFDRPSITLTQSAFERSENIESVIKTRDVGTEKKVLDNVANMLKNGGFCFISVPAGKGGATLNKDSMGLYGCYWEYDEISWKKIIGHDKFVCLEQNFFIENNKKWEEVDGIARLKDVTANMKNYAAGLAVAVLQKK